MTEGVISAITIAFCFLFYPPITEKLKKIIQLKEQKNYDKSEVYSDITEAVRKIIYANVLTALWYVLYFFIATQYLVSKFGAFAYGDNYETFIYLIWVGIPYVASYFHFVIRAGNYQAALKKSNLKNQENDSKAFWYTFYTPMILFMVVQKIFQFSMHYPSKNIFLLLMGIK